MQSSAAHIYVISAASVTVRWHTYRFFQTPTHRPNSGTAFSPEVRRGQVVSLWQRKLFTRCTDKLLPGALTNGWNRDPACNGPSPFWLIAFLCLRCVYTFSFQSLLDLECQNPELRGSSGGVEGGSLRLLMDFCIFSGLHKSNHWKHPSECKSTWDGRPPRSISHGLHEIHFESLMKNLQTSEWMLLCTATTR